MSHSLLMTRSLTPRDSLLTTHNVANTQELCYLVNKIVDISSNMAVRHDATSATKRKPYPSHKSLQDRIVCCLVVGHAKP